MAGGVVGPDLASSSHGAAFPKCELPSQLCTRVAAAVDRPPLVAGRARPFRALRLAAFPRLTQRTHATVLAERTFVPGQPIAYQNLQVALTGTPKIGDVFTIDNNSDGFGSNDNLLRLISIESAKVLGNDETLHDAYLGLLNQAGSTARQAQVTQEALQVVYEQANEARDQVAGVNLDEEAANLIRFQQSYQASARLLQTANQLFDAILRL